MLTPDRATPAAAPAIAFERAETEVINHWCARPHGGLERDAGRGRHRTGEPRRRAVRAEVGDAADKAQLAGAITRERGAQIVRHARRAPEERQPRVAG